MKVLRFTHMIYHNAYDMKKFIAGIDFSKENFEELIRDYVGGNAEIITRNYDCVPCYECTLNRVLGIQEKKVLTLDLKCFRNTSI